MRGLSKLFRAPTYWAHRAVVFAIARLSCSRLLTVAGAWKYNYIYGISVYNVRINGQKWSMATICNSVRIQLYQISSELTRQAGRLRNMHYACCIAASCHHYDYGRVTDVIVHVTIRLNIDDFLNAYTSSIVGLIKPVSQ